MGGFAGGDEAGYWEEEKNEIFSRSSVNLTNESPKPSANLSCVAYKCKDLSIDGYEIDSMAYNSYYRAYQALLAHSNEGVLEEFVLEHKIVIESESLDLMSFLQFLRDECELLLSNTELREIAKGIASS